MTPASSDSSPVLDSSLPVRPDSPRPGTEDSGGPCGSIITSKKKGRKGHAKSRNGCRTCKKRKVKCDEVKPECGKCVRFGVTCDFKSLFSQSNSSPSQTSDLPEARRRGRPRNDWKRWLSELDSGKAAESPASQSVGDASGSSLQGPSPATLNVEDLELFHHYCTVTAATVGDARIWRDHAPQLGFEHPCVLHAMLAISAHHMARLRPLKAPRYLVSADRHYEMAVKGATQMLPSLSVDNCQQLYLVTVLVCFTAFAKGPAPGDLMVVTSGDKVPWLALLRGVKMVLQTIGSEVVLSGILEPKPPESPDSQPIVTRRRSEFVYWERSLEQLSELIRSAAEPELFDLYMSNIATLSAFFRETYGTEEDRKEPPEAEFSHIMAWIYRMDQDFIETLETRQPIALLILGHFAILLQELEHYWFIEGWGSHMVREIKRMVPPGFEELLL